MQKLLVLLIVVGVALGSSPQRAQPKMMGGGPADIKHYHYQLALLDQNGRHICGAVLIASQWALTAAHCRNHRPVAVRARSPYISSEDQEFTILYTAVHPQYKLVDNVAAFYDFALLLLSGVVAAGIPIPPINYKVNVGEEVVVSGWGSLWQGGRWTSPDYLQVIRMFVSNHTDCKNVYREYLGEPTFCAKTFNGNPTSPCSGDSGGPAVINDLLAGIVSGGTNCSEWPLRPSPAIFADVSHVIDWICHVTYQYHLWWC